jgi:hypothetical protein
VLQRTGNQVTAIYSLLNSVAYLPVDSEKLIGLNLGAKVHPIVKNRIGQDNTR